MLDHMDDVEIQKIVVMCFSDRCPLLDATLCGEIDKNSRPMWPVPLELGNSISVLTTVF
jgi:hypothetical protein